MLTNVATALFGLADLWVRHTNTRREQRYLNMHLLPEKDTDILQVDDLGAIRRKVAELHAAEDSFLPQLIDLSILQLFTSRSLEQTVEIYTSTLELISHRLDLAYQTMRFLVWVIPTTGFIGTVVGILSAFNKISAEGNATLTTVASPIANALIATAAGLFAAIPAVVAYNSFVSRIRIFDTEMSNFAADFLNIVKRHFFK